MPWHSNTHIVCLQICDVALANTLSWQMERRVAEARHEEYGLLSHILGLKLYNMLLVFLVPSV